MENLLQHQAYNIAKGEIEEALQEIQLSRYNPETTLKSTERIKKYSDMLRDTICDGPEQ